MVMEIASSMCFRLGGSNKWAQMRIDFGAVEVSRMGIMENIAGDDPIDTD